MGTLKSLSVFALLAAVAAALLAPASGCAAKRKARESQSVARIYAKTAFVNDTDAAIRLSIVIGERIATPPGIGSSLRAEPQLIPPGGTYAALVQEKKPYGVGFLFPDNQDLVVRFKVESAGATWEPQQLAWYEVVGAMPESIRLVPNPAGPPGVTASTGRVEMVPREWWPRE